MSLNRANMLTDTNSPKLARADINDMFADLGYEISGNTSPVSDTGGIGKIVKIDSSESINVTGTYKIDGTDVINSINHSLVVEPGIPTTIFTALAEDAKYDVFVYIPGYPIPYSYINAVLITSSTGEGACFIQNITSPLAISLSTSGLNLQVMQGTEGSETVYSKIKKLY